MSATKNFSTTSPKNNNFIPGDLIQNRAYPLTFGVVVRSDWAANGSVPGYVVRCDAAWYRGRALTFIPADLAELLHRDEPVSITVREAVTVAACSFPTDPNELMSETPEQKAEREAAWSHLWDSQQASGVSAEQNNADRARQSARTMAMYEPMNRIENEEKLK